MKKLLYLFLAVALPVMFLASCSDDDDYPQVRIGVDYTGATDVDGTLYLAQGDTLNIDSVFVVSKTEEPALITTVTYVLDGAPLGIAPTPPYKLSLLTATLQPGKHILRLQMGVYQNGKTPGIAYVSVPFNLVENPSDIPAGSGTNSGRINSTPDVRDK